jgi:hydroxyacylglutathione hydrolase
LTFVITDTATSREPLGALTGDFLFVGDVGRPDLLETAAGQAGTMEGSARRLFSSLRRLADFPDHLLIWPGHGSGSACGKSLGGVPVSSLGYERLTNWGLRESGERAFVRSVLADQPDPPHYFGEMKRLNRDGGSPWAPRPVLAAVNAAELRKLVSAGQLLIDVRPGSGMGSLPGAVTIPMGRSFAGWAGSVIPASSSFFILAADETEAAAARRALALIGRTGARGWIPPAELERYRERGGRTERIATTAGLRDGHALVDVRSSAEWKAGHLDGAVHVPLARLPERIVSLDRSVPLLVYCQAGMRAAVAATALRRLGFARVVILEGGLDGFRERMGRTQRTAAVA